MTQSKHPLSTQTFRNILVDTGLFLGGLVASLSGIYFLFLPDGGFRGGRNPLYGIQVLFDRHTWDDLHTWSGIIMIAIAVIHLILHWKWVVLMTRRMFNELRGRSVCMSAGGRWNLVLDLVVAVSFILTALSGVYFLFVPGGRGAVDPNLLFSRFAWDMIHTWAGIIFVAGAVLHFAIHWRWVTGVTRRLFRRGLSAQPRVQQPEAVQG